ncbi:hypothetical protein [Streptoalloteichus hindustanus]|uniref:hypothetical protein n=1 Tax=Streptoalloteichus hindustanus TaxID=2017 RepID=UPI0009362F18|nr:hypothetical protein [Streptoalloteichus hindustanus]
MSLLFFGLGIVSMFTSVLVVLLGTEREEVNGTLTVEVRQDEVFKLVATRDTSCTVTPVNGEARRVVAEERPASRHRHAARGRVTAWFDGGAEIRCAGPARYESPDSVRMSTWSGYVPTFLGVAFSACLLIMFVQIFRRSRYDRAHHAAAEANEWRVR